MSDLPMNFSLQTTPSEPTPIKLLGISEKNNPAATSNNRLLKEASVKIFKPSPKPAPTIKKTKNTLFFLNRG
jgi:hypothetical protein